MINQNEMPSNLDNFTCSFLQNPFMLDDLQFAQSRDEQLFKEIYGITADIPPMAIELSKVLNKEQSSNIDYRDIQIFLDLDKKQETTDSLITKNVAIHTMVCHSNSSYQVNKPPEHHTNNHEMKKQVAQDTERTTFSPSRNIDLLQPLKEQINMGEKEKSKEKKSKEKINTNLNVRKRYKERLQQEIQSKKQGLKNQYPMTQDFDRRKNMYCYSFKHIIRELFSDEYKAFLAKLCIKHGVSDPQDIVSFYREKLLWSISLSNVLTLLDYEAHPVNSTEHKVIKAFHDFYVWYMRKRYRIHILKSTDIEYKEDYIEATRILIYLPRMRKLRVKETTHLTSEFQT